MALHSIETEWNVFARTIFTGMRPSPTQIDEMRKAFFAGAFAMFRNAKEIGCDHITEDEGTAYLDARQREFEEFAKKLIADHAGRN